MSDGEHDFFRNNIRARDNSFFNEGILGEEEKSGLPNIIIILADDLGFSDISCYGSEIKTSNLDYLASHGVRFTQMYNCARCCPTRTSLLTGLYPHQAGVGWMIPNLGIPAYQGYLNQRCVTIAEVLRTGGYRTLMSGKWHVGGSYPVRHRAKWSPGQKEHPRPIDRGFDQHFGTLTGAGSYFNPHTLICNDRLVEPEGEHFYYTDAISDNAVAMIETGFTSKKPFFLYVAYTAPHWPLHAIPEDVERYRDRYRKGWDMIRMERYERLKSMGMLSSQWALSPRDDKAVPWLEVKDKNWESARMAVYAAQIDRMDQGIGRIIAKLRELKIEKNTLVIFLSDNGGCAEFLKEDGGYRYECVLPRTREGRLVRCGNIPGLMPGPDDTYMSYDLPWANASNTPFRLYKHWVHEGGIATPMIVYWPALVQPGIIVDQPTHVVDIMATCLDAARIKYPVEHNGNKIIPLEGESLMPIFRDEAWWRKRPICWEHEGNSAVRKDEWKLVSKYPGKWELYNMEEDRTELNDQAKRNLSKLKELKAIYEEWADRCEMLAWKKIKPLVEEQRRQREEKGNF